MFCYLTSQFFCDFPISYLLIASNVIKAKIQHRLGATFVELQISWPLFLIFFFDSLVQSFLVYS